MRARPPVGCAAPLAVRGMPHTMRVCECVCVRARAPAHSPTPSTKCDLPARLARKAFSALVHLLPGFLCDMLSQPAWVRARRLLDCSGAPRPGPSLALLCWSCAPLPQTEGPHVAHPPLIPLLAAPALGVLVPLLLTHPLLLVSTQTSRGSLLSMGGSLSRTNTCEALSPGMQGTLLAQAEAATSPHVQASARARVPGCACARMGVCAACLHGHRRTL